VLFFLLSGSDIHGHKDSVGDDAAARFGKTLNLVIVTVL